MPSDPKVMWRFVLIALIAAVGISAVALVLTSCGSVNPPGTMAGHNTTLPAQPACLFFCFADVRSSIDTPTPASSVRDSKGKQVAPPVIVPPPVINSAPVTPAQKPASSGSNSRPLRAIGGLAGQSRCNGISNRSNSPIGALSDEGQDREPRRRGCTCH